MELIGTRGNSCEIAPLPEPLHGFTMARLGRSVVACGGFHRYERYSIIVHFRVDMDWVCINLTCSTFLLRQ